MASAAVFLSGYPAIRLSATAQVADPPALVVVLAVDQFAGGYLDRFGPQLTGGLARLSREGAVFTNAHQDHGTTGTAAGHASMLSGRYPSSTGIIRNSAGANDSTYPWIGLATGGSSPARFRGTTLFDWMKTRWPESRALGAGGDDRNVIMVVGRAREQVYWSTEGRFVTSTWYARELPTWVNAFNREAEPVVSEPGRVWDLLLPPSEYPEPDSVPWENRWRNVTFPHIGPPDALRAARAFRYTPWGDSLALAFLLRGVSELRLGHGPGPDLVVAGLASSDDVGHAFGPDSREMHDYVLRLDRWLGAFLDSLERAVAPRPITLVLTADHGVTPFPEASWVRQDSVPRHVRLDTLLLRWEAHLDSVLGNDRHFLFLSEGLIAMDRALIESRGVRMDTLLSQIRRDIGRVRGVARVQTRADLAAVRDTVRDGTSRRWLRTITPDSPLELFVTLGRGSDFGNARGPAQHGQNSERDTHVTMLLWGPGIRAGRYERKAAVVDVAPTLAHVLGIEPAEPVDGRILREAITPSGSLHGRP